MAEGTRGGLRAAVRHFRAIPAVNRAATTSALRLARASMRLATNLERHGIRAGDIRVRMPNGRDLVLASGDGDYWASRFWWHGWDAYEPESIRPWFRLAQDARTVLDVGANVGIFALVAGVANPQADCYAFEPVPRSCKALQRNVALNPTARVTVVPSAVGATNGTVDISWDPGHGHDLMAAVGEPGHRSPAGLARESVPMVTLDSWATTGKINTVDLVKIDVEGHEPEVLAGMAAILSKRPDVIIEILDDRTAAAVRDVVNKFGYNHYLLTPVGPIGSEQISAHSCLNHLLTTRDASTVSALW